MTYLEVLLAINRAVRMPFPTELAKWVGDYPEPYYHLFSVLSKSCSCKVAVELGVEKGRGSAALALGNPRCQVYGVESQPQVEIKTVQAAFPNFHFIEASSLPIPEGVPERIDLLHIDTEHSYSQALNEFTTYKSRLAPGTVVCFDDTHAMDDGVLQYLMTLTPYHPIILDDRLHPSCGYGVLYYE